MILGIIGVGVVGGVLMRWLHKNTAHELRLYDPRKGMSDKLDKCEALFICIPIPTNEYGRQETAVLELLVEKWAKVPIFVRSTVLPTTCDNLNKRYNSRCFAMPEFLTERTADADFDSQPILVGTHDEPESQLVRKVFPSKDIAYVRNVEAEIIKYGHNCFGALKVGYFNILSDLCTRSMADFERVKLGILLSGYINETHTQVPGPDGKYGFGGKCFPKDLKAFTQFLVDNKIVGAETLSPIQKDNEYFRSKGKAS